MVIVLLLENALDPLSDNMVDPVAGLLVLAAVIVSVCLVAFMVYLQRH